MSVKGRTAHEQGALCRIRPAGAGLGVEGRFSREADLPARVWSCKNLSTGTPRASPPPAARCRPSASVPPAPPSRSSAPPARGRRRCLSQLPLHPGVVRGSEGADPAVAPGLRRQPLHGERHPVALGAVAAARVHRDHGVPGAPVTLEPGLRAAVRRAQQDPGEAAVRVGPKTCASIRTPSRIGTRTSGSVRIPRAPLIAPAPY